MGIHAYFQSLNDLERIIRCPGKFKFQEHSVSAHSWKVVQYLVSEGSRSPIDIAKITNEALAS